MRIQTETIWREDQLRSGETTRSLEECGLDFHDSVEVFAGPTLDLPYERPQYGEVRIMAAGLLRGRMVIVIWTARGDVRHIISMRKANE